MACFACDALGNQHMCAATRARACVIPPGGGHQIGLGRSVGGIPPSVCFLAGPDGSYAERMLDLGRIDVEEIAEALADQTDDEHRWLIDPRTGEVAF